MTILYHFTAHCFVSSILKEGITRGILVDMDEDNKIQFIHGYQWLTENNSFNQEWCELSNLPYRRDEVRLTLDFPDRELLNILDWHELCKKNPNEMRDTLNEFGDPQNWYLYKGNIHFSRIKGVNFNPNYIDMRKKDAERYRQK